MGWFTHRNLKPLSLCRQANSRLIPLLKHAEAGCESQLVRMKNPRFDQGQSRKICAGFKNGGRWWIRTIEGVSQQIYSLPPLATWVTYQPHFETNQWWKHKNAVHLVNSNTSSLHGSQGSPFLCSSWRIREMRPDVLASGLRACARTIIFKFFKSKCLKNNFDISSLI